MRRFTIEVSDDAAARLEEVALAERRDLRDQAAIILMRALRRRPSARERRPKVQA